MLEADQVIWTLEEDRTVAVTLVGTAGYGFEVGVDEGLGDGDKLGEGMDVVVVAVVVVAVGDGEGVEAVLIEVVGPVFVDGAGAVEEEGAGTKTGVVVAGVTVVIGVDVLLGVDEATGGVVVDINKITRDGVVDAVVVSVDNGLVFP